jgi:hypothetical protein
MKDYHLKQLHKYLVNVTFEKFKKDVFPDLVNKCSEDYLWSKFQLLQINPCIFFAELDPERLKTLAAAITNLYECPYDDYGYIVEKAKGYIKLEYMEEPVFKEIETFIRKELLPFEYRLELDGYEKNMSKVIEYINILCDKIGISI